MYSHAICPVCNGLETLQAACPACSGQAVDNGRLSDSYGPYSPYMPVDELRLTNGRLDDGICRHEACCSRCGMLFAAPVRETSSL